MRARVHRIEVDVDLIGTAEKMIQAAGAGVSARLNFSANRGRQPEAGDIAGGVTYTLTQPNRFLLEVISQLVVLEAALRDQSPAKVLKDIESLIREPNKPSPKATMGSLDDITD